jgi:RNA polymerase sigma-70 factor (ECF subfamily)
VQLDLAVRLALDAGKCAWPGTDLGLEMFARRVREAGIAVEDLMLRAADLYLAYACADGDHRALEYFESELISRVETYVTRLGLSDHAIDEVRQNLRVKLLVGDPPGIMGYRGRGPLGAWVRVTAFRLGLRVINAGAAAARSTDVDLLDIGADIDDNPELVAARNLYRDRFRAALEEGLSSLGARDRTLLRLYAVDGLNIDDIGTIYRVHRATVARRLVAIRSRVLRIARERFGLLRDASSSEIRSLIILLRHEIHLSARIILVDRRA